LGKRDHFWLKEAVRPFS